MNAGEGTKDGTKPGNTSETVLAGGPGTTETIEESGTLTSPTRLTARSTARSTATRFQRFSTARTTPTRNWETSQTESVEEDVRKLTSGSMGFRNHWEDYRTETDRYAVREEQGPRDTHEV